MKKNLLISVFITFALSCFSQDYFMLKNEDDSERKFQIGLKAGLNVSNIQGMGNLLSNIGSFETIKSLPRFHAGLAAKFNFSKVGFVQPEILYSSLGCKSEDYSIVLGYIQVPTYVGCKIQTNSELDID